MSRPAAQSPKYFARPARREDAAEIARIYNEGIEDRVATFETELRTERDVLRWFEEGRTMIVVEGDGRVYAYATAFSYRPRSCYDGVREFSVYVSRDARGRGLGRIALGALIDAARARGDWKLLSRVFPENEASLRLLSSLGFRQVGTYVRHAKLDGEWRDVVIVEKLIDEFEGKA
ncbi:MAG TPA: arsinothricin resistance N-acetyltransferase ArsN1 family A [Xanthobacteraceae bacterium]|jgi:phosphinothricin acetyltransferase